MPRRTKNQNTLYLGDHNQLCDVCGFKYKASDLKERWDGFMVCEDDWEPRHPMDYFRPGPEHILPGSPEDEGTEPSPLNPSVLTAVPDGTNDGSL